MDSFTQAAAYLHPTFEFVTKLSSAIPLWMMMVMFDKHLLGIPLLEGSVWKSPRIPPRLSIGAKPNEERASRPESGQHSAPTDFSSFEPGFADSTTPYAQPTQPPLFNSVSPPVRASSVTALTIYQPLDLHGRFVHSTQWFESEWLTLSLALVLIYLFAGMISDGLWHPFGKRNAYKDSELRRTRNVGTQFTKPFTPEQILTCMEPLWFWENIPKIPTQSDPSMIIEDAPKEPQMLTCMKPVMVWEIIPSIPTRLDASKSIEDTLKEPQMASGGIECETEVTKERKETSTQEEKFEDLEVDVSVKEEKTEGDYDGNGSHSASEAGEGDDKEDSEEKGKDDNDEDGWSELGTDTGIDGVDGSPDMEEGTKKKKYKRVRTNAKKRAAKRAAEANTEGGDALNALPQDQNQREDGERQSRNVGPEVAKPEASDMLATTKGKAKEKAPAEDPEEKGRAGGYSFKETDLHDATFFAKATRKITSLPSRLPVPQTNAIHAPVGLPPRPQFPALPTKTSSSTSQSSLHPGANPFLSTSKGPARPKRKVPALLPHHQSFNAAQRLPTFGNTDKPSGASFFGHRHPDPPMFRNLPPGLFSNEVFKLPVPPGGLSGVKPSNAGAANATPPGQGSIFQNVPVMSGPFAGFGNSSPGAG